MSIWMRTHTQLAKIKAQTIYRSLRNSKSRAVYACMIKALDYVQEKVDIGIDDNNL